MKVYLVHHYNNQGVYLSTSSVAYRNKKKAQEYADNCVTYSEIEEVDLL